MKKRSDLSVKVDAKTEQEILKILRERGEIGLSRHLEIDQMDIPESLVLLGINRNFVGKKRVEECRGTLFAVCRGLVVFHWDDGHYSVVTAVTNEYWQSDNSYPRLSIHRQEGGELLVADEWGHNDGGIMVIEPNRGKEIVEWLGQWLKI